MGGLGLLCSWSSLSVASDIYFSEEKKRRLRLRRGEMVFFRLKVKSKTTNVAEIMKRKVEGGVKAFKANTRRVFLSEDIYDSLPKG